jgi:hypothetical protein
MLPNFGGRVTYATGGRHDFLLGFIGAVELPVSRPVVAVCELFFDCRNSRGEPCDEITYFPLKIGSWGEFARIQVTFAIEILLPAVAQEEHDLPAAMPLRF